MPGQVTFNLIKDGIVGHINVTLTKGSFSQTLGNSADLSTFPIGIYSPAFEANRKLASVHLIEKTISVDDTTFLQLKSYFADVTGNQTHYGLFFGVNCIDFTQTVYKMTGAPGHFADLFSESELEGPLSGWLMSQAKTGNGKAAQILVVKSHTYQDTTQGSFGISGGIIILLTLLLVTLSKRLRRRSGSSLVNRFRALARAATGSSGQ